MSDLYGTLSDIKTKSDGVKTQKVARFAYTSVAYSNDDYQGVPAYDHPLEQNIPAIDKTDLNDTVLNKGVRSQAASLPRNAINHFFGRMSYNLNKLNDWFNDIVATIMRSMAMNGSRYTATTKYRQYDVCTFVDTTISPPLVRYFFRHSTDPAELVGSPPLVSGAVQTAQWSEFSTTSAQAHKFIRTDASGRAKIANPDEDSDIANKGWVRDFIYPVNSYYVQYPDAASNTDSVEFPTAQSPASLFGGTWAEQWSTESVFFRTRGTLSDNGRTNGKQEDATQGHIHRQSTLQRETGGSSFPAGSSYFADTAASALVSRGIQSLTLNTGDPADNGTHGTPRSASETRTVNRRIKVWKRTA